MNCLVVASLWRGEWGQRTEDRGQSRCKQVESTAEMRMKLTSVNVHTLERRSCLLLLSSIVVQWETLWCTTLVKRHVEERESPKWPQDPMVTKANDLVHKWNHNNVKLVSLSVNRPSHAAGIQVTVDSSASAAASDTHSLYYAFCTTLSGWVFINGM